MHEQLHTNDFTELSPSPVALKVPEIQSKESPLTMARVNLQNANTSQRQGQKPLHYLQPDSKPINMGGNGIQNK
jgi:hypothetical protein